MTTAWAPPEGVFLNLTFLNLYRHGEAYTEGQYRAWMTEAGFQDISRSRLAEGSTLFRARLTALADRLVSDIRLSAASNPVWAASRPSVPSVSLSGVNSEQAIFMKLVSVS